MSCHAEAKIDLPLAPEAAWDAVMDWEGQSRWMLFTRVWATEQDGRGVGGGVSARTAVGALGFTDHMVITKWAPPHECRVKHLGTVVRGEGAFVVTPVPAGSTFAWSEDVVPPLGRLGAAGWPVVRPAFELMMRTSLRRLAKQVSAR
jgi:Polyketide cyclase / dehydrase and lipid transport